jgi:hypothetical protein
MNSVRLAAAFAALSLVFGCSSSHRSAAGLDPGAPDSAASRRPEGAVTMTVTPDSNGDVCTGTHGPISAPGGDGTYNELTACNLVQGCVPDQYVLVDGDHGQTAQCTVRRDGANYDVSLSMTSQMTVTSPELVFSATGTLPAGSSGTGTFAISAYDTQTQESLVDPGCTVTFAPNTGAVSDGKVWAHFECNALKDPHGASASACASSGGFLFEDCEH